MNREVSVSSGSIDNLYITIDGQICVVETKLWRNPEAHRTVIAQIISYAKALTMMSFDEFCQAVTKEKSSEAIVSFFKKIRHKNGPQFVLIPKNKQLINKIDHAIANSTKNIRIITSWKRYLKALVIYKTALATSLTKGTKILVVVYEKKVENSESKDAKIFRDQTNSSIRYVDTTSEVIEVIVDDQEVFLMTDPKLALAESPALWSTNKSLITALSTCFDSFWKKPNSCLLYTSPSPRDRS